MIRAYDPAKKLPPPPKRPLTLSLFNTSNKVCIVVVDPFTGVQERTIGHINEDDITLYSGAKIAIEEIYIDTSGVAWAKDGSLKVTRDNG